MSDYLDEEPAAQPGERYPHDRIVGFRPTDAELPFYERLMRACGLPPVLGPDPKDPTHGVFWARVLIFGSRFGYRVQVTWYSGAPKEVLDLLGTYGVSAG